MSNDSEFIQIKQTQIPITLILIILTLIYVINIILNIQKISNIQTTANSC